MARHFKGHKIKLCYEASYIGYCLQRALISNDIHCDIVSPSSIPSPRGKAIKTDRIDAGYLAQFYANNLLTIVQPPGEEQEQDRDLLRSRQKVMQQRTQLRKHLQSGFFQDNPAFLGTTLEQSPLISTEAHLVKIIRPDLWLSLDANYYSGGDTESGGDTQNNKQRNSRIGGTVVFPIKGRHALRGSFSSSLATRSGGDYDKISVSYLYAW